MPSTRCLGTAVFLLGTLACGPKHAPAAVPTPPGEAVTAPVVRMPPPVILRPIRRTNVAGASSLYPPSLEKTPGALDPRVTQATIQESICVPAYLDTVQPSIAYIDPIKTQMLRGAHLPGRVEHYALDHLVPLNLGGHPTSPRNLWMEPYGDAKHPLITTDKWPDDGSVLPGAHQKDEIELMLNKQVCDGAITLKEAQDKIRTDWHAVYKEVHSR